ncbi:MAG: hypothetical protein PHT53_04860 [Candidatus Omnitrophica bacterium]|nr:hypothetical protein [Candidatus Omnitrophota bacterium]
MKKIVFIAFAVILLSANAFAKGSSYIKVQVQLVDFEEHHTLPYANENGDYDYVTPVAKFKISEPTMYRNKIIGITYRPNDYNKINELNRSIGDFYAFEVPQDYLYGNFFEIDEGYVNNFIKEQ